MAPGRLRAAAAACACAIAVAGPGELSFKTGAPTKLPFGLNPAAAKDWDFSVFDGTVSVGGTYDLSEMAFKPSAVSLGAARPGFRGKVTLQNPVSKRPEVEATATFGDVDAGDYVALSLDSSEPTPTLLEAKRIAVPKTGVVLSPSWRPRVPGVEGLAVDVDAPLHGSDRAVVTATLAPKTRPKVRFHFGLDDDATLDITPLLGSNGTSTKWELEKRNLKYGVTARATLLDKTLTLLAKIPFGGTLVPSVAVALDDLGAKPKFALKQAIAF